MSGIHYVEEFKFTPTGRKIGPSGSLSLEQLSKLTGITYRQVILDGRDANEILLSVPESKNYDYRDVVDVSPRCLGPNYRKTLSLFDKEHIHGTDEVRFFLEGSAFYEIRDLDDNWIRMTAKAGDFLCIPKGLFHRFFLDKYQHCKAVRLFAKNPAWAGIYRSQGAESHPARLEYLTRMGARKD